MPDTGQGGNLSNLLKDIMNKNATTTEGFADVLGTLADIGGVIGLTMTIYNWCSAQDNELQDVLNAIQAGFNGLQGQISASDKLARMRDIDQGIAPAAGVFQQLPAILVANPPVTNDFKLQQIQTCITAVLFFTDNEDKWQVAAADMPYYSDSFSGTIAPQAGSDGLVFNYTYTLPQFLRAICYFLATVAALEPTSLNSYTDTLTKCITRLQTVHQTIIGSGLVVYRDLLRPTDIGQIYYLHPNYTGGFLGDVGKLYWHPNGESDYLPGKDGWDSSNSPHFVYKARWVKEPSSSSAQDGINWPYGAVEIYSGASNISSYSSDYFPRSEVDLSFWAQVYQDNFQRLLNLRAGIRRKALYVSLGMPSVWQTINRLLQLTGQPLPTTPTYDSWQFADVISLLGLYLAPQPGHHLPIGGDDIYHFDEEPAGLEDALKTFLQSFPPYAGFPAFTNNPNVDFNWDNANVWVPPINLPTGSLYTFLTGVSLTPVNKQPSSGAGGVAHTDPATPSTLVPTATSQTNNPVKSIVKTQPQAAKESTANSTRGQS